MILLYWTHHRRNSTTEPCKRWLIHLLNSDCQKQMPNVTGVFHFLNPGEMMDGFSFFDIDLRSIFVRTLMAGISF